MKTLIFLILDLSAIAVVAQRSIVAKVSASKSDFIHSTGTIFPVSTQTFTRESLIAIDAKGLEMAAYYTGPSGRFKVHLLPIKKTSLESLRIELLKALGGPALNGQYPVQEDAMLSIEPEIQTYSANGYTLRGLTGRVMDSSEYATVFECGKWLVKFQFSTSGASFENYNEILKEFLTKIEPSILVKRYPWNSARFQVVLDSRILPDKAFASCILLGAMVHALWIQKNIDSLERCAGVPGLHLMGFEVAWKMAAETWLSMKGFMRSQRQTHLNWMSEVATSGFLREYIMSVHHGLLVVPDTVSLNMDAFRKWKSMHPDGGVRKAHTYYTIISRK